MAKLINLSTPDSGIANGMELSFRAPCDCSDVTGVTLAGVEYALVDASGESLSGCSKYFVKNAVLTVIIDTENKKATLLNPRVNTYTKTLGTPDDTASASGSTLWARVKQLIADIAGKAPSVHKHLKEDITDFAHNHDERYYTESEMDTKLTGKSDTTHKHVKADIEDFAHNHDDRYFTETEVITKLSEKSDTGHNHDDRYFTETEMALKLAEKSDTNHNHDGRYYTETEMDNKLSGKSDTGHKHTKSEITDFPTSMPASDVSAWAKAPNKPSYTPGEVGAYSKTETDNLLSGKSSTGHKHKKADIEDFPATMPPSSHTHSKSDITDFPTSMPPTAHTHTKSQITDFPTSMPASDVYAWAKASNKPSYTASEVGASVIKDGDGNKINVTIEVIDGALYITTSRT